MQDTRINDKAAAQAEVGLALLTHNEYRHIFYPDLADVPWGDVAWMDANRLPVFDGEPPPPPAPVIVAPPPAGAAPGVEPAPPAENTPPPEPPPAKSLSAGGDEHPFVPA